jgi:penicillin-binding protein 2
MFAIIARAMQDVVDRGTGRVAQLPGIEICAKTGTVENKAVIHGQAMKMKDHSVFVAFAPREHPKIAVAVVVENAGFGATWAGPVASLLIEKYLTDSIATNRKYLEQKLYDAKLISPYIYTIDSAQRAKDALRWERKQEAKRLRDSIAHAQDSIMIRRWFEKRLGRQLPAVLKAD